MRLFQFWNVAMNSGIYRIKNIVTDMVYIGQAYNFQKRWKNHCIELNLNRHCNPYLQSAWNKYGSYNFEFGWISINLLIEH